MSTKTRAFAIRPHDPADDAAIVSISRVNYPDSPHGSLEDYRASVRNREKHGHRYLRYVAEVDGRVTADAFLMDIKTSEDGLFWSDIQVLPSERRQGVGRDLLERVTAEALTLGGRRLLGEYYDAPDGTGKAFAEAMGFEPNGGHGEQESRLDVANANLEGFDGAEEMIRRHNIRILRLSEIHRDESFLGRLYEVDMQTHRDVPSPVEWVDMPYDEWYDVVITGPGRSAEWSWVALEGDQPVGMARLRLYEDGMAGNAYTGVGRAYRGKGIARALKYRTVLWCRENGITHIFTGNSVHNQRMLAINASLGYKFLPVWVEVVKDLG